MDVQGQVGGHPISEEFEPPFTMELSRDKINMEAELSRLDRGQFGETVDKQNLVSLAGLDMPVVWLRWGGVAGLIAGLAGVAALAVYWWPRLNGAGSPGGLFWLGASPIPVTEVHSSQEALQVVHVSSLKDLKKLADREGRSIFCHDQEDRRLYFITDGQVTCKYTESAQ